jgi:hypothetical protein
MYEKAIRSNIRQLRTRGVTQNKGGRTSKLFAGNYTATTFAKPKNKIY